MNFGSTAIKLNSVKSYNVKANNANNVFKNKFYSDSKIDSDNYYKYEDIDYNKINLEESIEKVVKYEEKTNKILNTINEFIEFRKKMFYSSINLALGFTKGIVSFAETLLKGCVVISGTINSLGTGLFDIGRGLFTGNWDFSETKSLWTKQIIPAISTDYTQKGFDYLYENGPLKYVNDNSFGFAKTDGVLYGVSESVGYYTGLVVATTLTCGATGVAAGTTAANLIQGGLMAGATLGKETTKNFSKVQEQAAEEGREITWSEIGTSLGKSAGKAIIEGGIMATAGAAGKSDVIKNSKFASKVGKKLAGDLVSTGIKATKPLISEVYTSAIDNKSIDWKKVGVDTAATIISEGVNIGIKGAKGNYRVPSNSVNSEVKKDIDSLRQPNSTSSEGQKVQTDFNKNMQKSKFIVGTLKKSEEKAIKEISKKAVKEVLE